MAVDPNIIAQIGALILSAIKAIGDYIVKIRANSKKKKSKKKKAAQHKKNVKPKE